MASSKGALVGLSTASAFELAEHGITVNTILPAAVITPGAIGAKGPATRGAGHASDTWFRLVQDPRRSVAAVCSSAS